MTTRRVPLSGFSDPPREYDPAYMADIVRTYAQGLAILNTPGEGRHTFMVLTALQTDDVALEAGTLYRDGNVLKISLLNIAAARGASATGSVGTVTVST